MYRVTFRGKKQSLEIFSTVLMTFDLTSEMSEDGKFTFLDLELTLSVRHVLGIRFKIRKRSPSIQLCPLKSGETWHCCCGYTERSSKIVSAHDD